MLENIKYEVKHLRSPIKQKSDNWQDTADHWLFTFDKGVTCNYFTGICHRVAMYNSKEFNRLKNANLTAHGFEEFLKISKPVKPDLKGVIYSLWQDSQASSMSFKDWCSNFGYDTDSRKALETYEACQQNAEKLHKLGLTDQQVLETYFEGY